MAARIFKSCGRFEKSALGRVCLITCLTLGTLLTLAVRFTYARGKVPLDYRIGIIRGLDSEVAVTKVALPRGKHGIEVNADGKVDESNAQTEFRTHGIAIQPGTPVEITKISFKSNRIIFEINGGGKRKTKWYQHIQIGVGGTTQPVVPIDNSVAITGSSISLVFKGKVPDPTTNQVKQMLSQVLDFNRRTPTVLYSPSVPPRIKEAIRKHQVIVGMDRDAVLSAKGTPERKVRTPSSQGDDEREDWIYGLPPHVLFVTFEGDNVVSVRQY